MADKRNKPDATPVVFRRYITIKGRVLDAHDYGHKAWPIIRRPKK